LPSRVLLRREGGEQFAPLVAPLALLLPAVAARVAHGVAVAVAALRGHRAHGRAQHAGQSGVCLPHTLRGGGEAGGPAIQRATNGRVHASHASHLPRQRLQLVCNVAHPTILQISAASAAIAIATTHGHRLRGIGSGTTPMAQGPFWPRPTLYVTRWPS